MADYYLMEITDTKDLFDLDEILVFQLKHDVQIIRGDDFQYICYIDGKGYSASLTPMYALVSGIDQYKFKN